MATETKMSKPTFTHNGVAISLEANGRFSAMSPTGRITSGSLDGIKKQLDKVGTFAPFKAFSIYSGYQSTVVRECTVVGFAEPKRRYGTRCWKVDEGTRTREVSEVYEDTPANRAAAQAYLGLVKEHRALRGKQEAAEQKLLAKLKTRRPEKKE